LATITEILILHGLLPIEVLDTLMAGDPADETAVRALVAEGVISEAQFAKARAAQANLPFVELSEYPVDRLAIALVPVAVCRRHEVLPILIDGNRLVLAMVDPGNVFAVDDVREASGMRVTQVVAERADLPQSAATTGQTASSATSPPRSRRRTRPLPQKRPPLGSPTRPTTPRSYDS
jgi:type IV pilus assembly protein PilB